MFLGTLGRPAYPSRQPLGATVRTRMERQRNRRRSLVAAAIVCLYLGLAVGRALTTYPWNDEAWYASPSWSYIHYGHTGTPLLETAGKFWKGINQHTYWVAP